MIRERDAEFEACHFVSNRKRIAFLDLLLKEKKQDKSLTTDAIQEEVDTFMFEGHDTTASAISWTIQMIGTHLDVQKKLHEEMDRVFGDSERQITHNDLHMMEHLECVIKEALRINSAVPLIGRRLTETTQICENLKRNVLQLI